MHTLATERLGDAALREQLQACDRLNIQAERAAHGMVLRRWSDGAWPLEITHAVVAEEFDAAGNLVSVEIWSRATHGAIGLETERYQVTRQTCTCQQYVVRCQEVGARCKHQVRTFNYTAWVESYETEIILERRRNAPPEEQRQRELAAAADIASLGL